MTLHLHRHRGHCRMQGQLPGSQRLDQQPFHPGLLQLRRLRGSQVSGEAPAQRRDTRRPGGLQQRGSQDLELQQSRTGGLQLRGSRLGLLQQRGSQGLDSMFTMVFAMSITHVLQAHIIQWIITFMAIAPSRSLDTALSVPWTLRRSVIGTNLPSMG